MITISILSGDMEGRTFQVDKPLITCGRRADNVLPLPHDPRISRLHARLVQRGGDWLLEDVGSVNGTFVGQRRIHGPTVIRPGDRFRMGRTWMTIQPPQKTSSEAEAARNVHLLGSTESRVQAADLLSENVVYSVGADHAPAETDAAQAQRRLEVMSRVSATLASTLNLGELLDAIIGSVMTIIPADRGFVMLVDRATGEFVPRAIRRRQEEGDEGGISVSRHILEHAINDRMAIMTADATTDARFENLDSVHDLGIRSAICAPLLHGEEALGTIFLDSPSAVHAFSKRDVEILMTIAGQAATAIENARLYTDLRHAYDSLRSAQEQLLRSERLSTVGAFSASIAHDMANIITPLKPLLKIVLKECPVDSEASESLNRQMDRLTAMLERIMSFSRSNEVHLQPTSVNEVLQKTLSLIQSEILHREVKLVEEFEEGLAPVMADQAQLDRVFLNVAINALEAMEESEERVLTIRTERDGEEVAISFTDTGPGISVENQEKLFEPLFTTKPSGTGLGLHSCKRILEEELHGSIEVDSMEGIGATFTIRLPAAAKADASASSAPQPASQST